MSRGCAPGARGSVGGRRPLRARVGCSSCRNIGGRRHGSDRRAAPARPRSEHRSAAPLSFPASAHPPCRVRGDARWLATGRTRALCRIACSARRVGCGARPPRRNAPRARATSAQWPFCARRVRAPRGSHRPARRTGSPTHFASFRRARPRPSGSSSCSRVLQRRRRAAISPTVIASCWRRSRSLPDDATVVAQVRRRREFARTTRAGRRTPCERDRAPS